MTSLPAKDNRNASRIRSHFHSIYPIVQFVDPANIAAVDSEAEVVDISETGMGLYTKTPMKVGHTIHFKRQRHWKLPKGAVVIWSLRHKDGFRAGIRFTE